MNDNFEAYKDLVELMRAAPKAQAPEGFTGKVMTTLPACNPQECAFYFFITGFFYLIMGLVLMSGFKISSNMTAVDWIRLQPQVTLGIAIWLFALGAVLMADGRSIVRLARLGTLFYIFFHCCPNVNRIDSTGC